MSDLILIETVNRVNIISRIQLIEDNPPFKNLRMNINSFQRYSNGLIILTVGGLFERKMISLKICLKTYQDFDIHPRRFLFSSSCQFYMIAPNKDGSPSNNFVQKLKDIYGLSNDFCQIKNSVDLSLTPLNVDMTLESFLNYEILTKAFLDLETERKYAEFYLNFNYKDNYVEFAEKDIGFRSNIIDNFII